MSSSTSTDRHTRRRLALRGEARLSGDMLTQAQLDLLMSKIQETPDGHWLWLGSVDPDGYPQAVWRCRRYRIHVLMNERAEGSPLPEGLEVDHTCNRRDCVNPSHLERVTHQENVRRIRARAARPLFSWRSAKDAAWNAAHLQSISQE